MKKSMLILAFLSLMFALKSNAQWIFTGPTTIGASGYLQTDGPYNIFFGNNAIQMTLNAAGKLGIGITPTFQLDVNASPAVGDGINIASGSGIVAYNIAGRPFLWYKNSPLNVFCGLQAGNSISPTGTANSNVYCGYQSGFSDIIGEFNTFIGSQAGFSDIGNSSNGSAAGDYNTFVGNRSGYYTISGQQNCYYGVLSGYLNSTGSANCEFGDHSGQKFGADLDSNSFYGFETGYSMMTGNSNVLVGDNSGWATGHTSPGFYNTFVGAFGGSTQLNPGGNYNVTLGYGADAYTGTSGSPGPITNAAAIGAEALVLNDNQFILGNTSQLCGIGMSTDPIGPMANLEIETNMDQNVPLGPYPTPTGFLGNGSNVTYNPYLGQGFSGLKFRDLTSSSIPNGAYGIGLIQTPPIGYLTLDQHGNVIYDSLSSIFGGCSNPTLLTQNTEIDLNDKNFYFKENGGGLNTNDVYIGYPCGTTLTPDTKLAVREHSLSPSSIALYVENDDQSSGSYGSPSPLIGIQSFIPAPPLSNPCSYYNVAGWFQANYTSTCTTLTTPNQQYAIFVPNGGGTVDIGFPFSTDNPGYMLKVNGTPGVIGGVFHASDSTIKKNINPLDNALSIIEKLQGVSYNYIDSIIADSGMAGLHYGFLAQQVERVLPAAVKTMPNPIRNTPLKALSYNDIIPWLVEGMKQQQGTIDSLKNVLNSMQTCLNNLCGGGLAPVRNNGGGNGNNGGDNTIGNVQDVMLSANANAPLLYQNIPNPFSTGTKINYYLPEGTQGATMMFYDSYGNQLKTVPLSQTGNGTLNITPDNLGAGIYSYSLVVNGTIIDTKRMILQK